MDKSSTLEQLRHLDEHLLVDVVRQDQRNPGFVITTWQVSPLSDKGIANPEGLFRFSGMGFDPSQPGDERSWTVVLKILQAPPEDGKITNIWYWKREFLAVQSGLLADLPVGGLQAPRFYGTSEQKESLWIWMECIQETDPPRWPLERFPSAAFSMGKFNGAYLAGKPLPQFAWLSRDQGIDWTKDTDPDGFWGHPACLQVLSAKNISRLQRLYAVRERFFHIYRALPQVFSHGDSSRRNHLFRRSAIGAEEMISIDWAWCGIAPLGWDLMMLLVDSALLFEMEPEELPKVEETAFPMYLEGLHSSGWQGDRRLVRLGYCVSATLFPLMPMPHAASIWSSEGMRAFAMQTLGCHFDEIAQGWRVLNDHLLNLAEEALSLMDEISL